MPAASLTAFEAELREAQAKHGHHMQWERGKDGKLRPVDIAAIELPENEIKYAAIDKGASKPCRQ